jgi:hypothetical protein
MGGRLHFDISKPDAALEFSHTTSPLSSHSSALALRSGAAHSLRNHFD